MLTRRQFSKLLSGAVASPIVVSSGAVLADEWPSRPVTIIIPFSAGGTTDIIGRQLAEELRQKFGQPFVIDNRTGAAGNIGVEAVVRAPKDGYTLLIGTVGSLAANQHLYTLPYSIQNDLAPVSKVFAVDHVLCTNPKFPAANMKELVAYAQANPGKAKYGSSGIGSAVHLFGVLIEMRTGIKMLHVPYRGSAPAVNDVVAGHIDMIIDGIPSIIAQVEGGKMNPLAITAGRRNKRVPNVPTMMESGIPDYDTNAWGTMMAPAGTPEAIRSKLSAAIADIYKKPEMLKIFADQGADAVSSTPTETAAFVKREGELWGAVVKAGNVKIT
jgi:tripartite-type tricarboxylate transporter receptor subunit TctC